MRPQTAVRLINKHMRQYYSYDEHATKNFSKVMLRALERLYYRNLNEVSEYKDSDTRTGEETYGYDNNYGNLHYISDRWNCSFRMRWLIDGIKAGYF